MPVLAQSAGHALDSFLSCCIPEVSRLRKTVVTRCDDDVFCYLDVW
jgi:hypothetical protein